jgi:hypothetical protein
LRKKWAVRRLPGRSFFVLVQDFFVCGGVAFLQGFLGKMHVLLWCFCGDGVVICVADVVFLQ